MKSRRRRDPDTGQHERLRMMAVDYGGPGTDGIWWRVALVH